MKKKTIDNNNKKMGSYELINSKPYTDMNTDSCIFL